MVRWLLARRPGASRLSLAKQLQKRLRAQGVRYHERTIRRQFTGRVATVPQVVEQQLQAMVMEAGGFRCPAELESALGAAGLAVPPEQRIPAQVSVARIVPLVRLWLYHHPRRSKRSLALALSEDLAAQGRVINPDRLQARLAGQGRTVPREVLAQLLEYLRPFGVTSERAASRLVEAEGIRRSLTGRQRVDGRQFAELARIWRLRQRGASSRSLAILLARRLAAQGIPANLHHLQVLLSGKARSGPRRVLTALQALVDETLPPGQSRQEALRAPAGAAEHDLLWVRARPIAALAQQWLEQHPGHSRRQLAQRITRSAQRMGYDVGHAWVQVILSGRATRTRGYVYRAMLKQCEGRERGPIPLEHILPNQIAPTPAPSRRKASQASGPPVRGQVTALSRFLAEIARIPALSLGEERELGLQIEQGDQAAWVALVQFKGTRRALCDLGAQLRLEAHAATRDCGAAGCCAEQLEQLAEIERLDREREALQSELAVLRRSTSVDPLAGKLAARSLSSSGATAHRPPAALPNVAKRSLRLALARNEAALAQAIVRASLGREQLESLGHQLESMIQQLDAEGRAARHDAAPSEARALRAAHQAFTRGAGQATRARQRLVESHFWLAVWFARRYTGHGVTLADLVQEANIGLTRAVDRFDPGRGLRFSTYAGWWIRHQLRRAIASQGRTIRLPVRVIQEIGSIGRARRALGALGREPTAEEIAQATHLTAAKVDELTMAAQHPLSTERTVGAHEGLRLGDCLPDRHALSPFEATRRQALGEAVEQLLGLLTPVEEQVLRLRFGIGDGEERTLAEIGQQLAVSREWVRKLEARALEKLRHGPSLPAAHSLLGS